MPYKDINQQREKARLAMRILRAQRKGLTAEEITRLTTDGLTKTKRVNKVNKKGLTSQSNPQLNSQFFTNLVREVQSEIQQTQQSFLTAMENLIRHELGKFSPPSGLKTPKPTPSHPKPTASPEKIKVDIRALEKSTGLKRDWRPNSP
jgi:DNA-binding transcriptional MerR regulator